MQNDIRCERSVVLHVLDHEHTRAELEGELDDLDGETLAALEGAGVVVIDGQRVRASESLRRLDALGLIAV